jgi:hypothetical protein
MFIAVVLVSMMAVSATTNDTINDDSTGISTVSANEQSNVESNVIEKSIVSINGDSNTDTIDTTSQGTINKTNLIAGDAVANNSSTTTLNKQESNIKTSTSKIDTTVNTNKFLYAKKGDKVNISATVLTVDGKSTAGSVVFKLNGISIGTAKLVNNQASILYDTSSLSQKNYTILAKYGGSTSFNPSQSSSTLQVSTTINKYTFSQLGDAANRVKVFIENNNQLPNYVVIGNEKVKMNDFLYMLSKTSLSKASVVHPMFTEASSANTNCYNTKIYKDEYSSLSLKVINEYENTAKNPTKVTSSVGTIGYNDLVYIYSRLVAYMYNNGEYPNYCTVLPLSTKYEDYMQSTQKQDINIKLNSFEVNPNMPATVSATFTYGNGTSVNGLTTVFKVNGITIGSAKINNGKASLTFDVPNWKIKNYTLTAKVGATNTNYEATQQSTLSVVKFSVKNTKIILEPLYIAQKDKTFKLTAKVLDDSNNPVDGGKFVIKLNGVSAGSTTVSGGVATISFSTSSLSTNKVNSIEAIYGGTTKYKSSKNSSYIRTVPSLSTYSYSQVLDASVRVKNYIEQYESLPKYVVIGSDNVAMPEFLYLLAEVVTTNKTYSNGKFGANISSYNTRCYGKNLVESEYVKAAGNIISFYANNSRAPSAISTAIGTINFEDTMYIYARVVAYISNNKILPAYAVVSKVKSDSSSYTSDNTVASGYQQYLVKTKNCEVNATIFKNAVAKAIAGVSGAYNQAKAIFDYVNKYTTYSYYANTRYGSVQTLSQGYGNCVDMAHVCVAMFRTANLPARYVHGKSCVFRSGLVTGHVWAEVYVNGKWVQCDATSDYNSFGTIVNWSRNSGEVRYTELPF